MSKGFWKRFNRKNPVSENRLFASKTVESSIPFDGFFNSYSEREAYKFAEVELEDFQEIADEQGIEFDKDEIDFFDYFDWEGYAKEYVKEYCDFVIDIIDIGLGSPSMIKFKDLFSPKFYNYSTDSITVLVPEKTVEKNEKENWTRNS